MAIVLNSNGLIDLNGTVIHCSNVTYNPGVVTTPVTVDGDPSPHSYKVLNASPVITFTSNDVVTVLSESGTTASSESNISVYFQSLASEGVRSDENTKVSFTSGFLVPETITGTQDNISTITCSIYPISSDGVTDPITTAINSTMPVFSALDSNISTLGACSINTTPIEGVNSWTLQFNPTVQDNRHSGNTFSTQYSLMSQAPVARITSQNPNQTFTICDGSIENTKLYTAAVLNLNSTSGGIVSTANVTITLDAGIISIDSKAGSQGQIQTVDYVLSVAGGRGSGITVS